MNENTLKTLPVKPADILVPQSAVDPEKWAVVACDQFTQDGDYWARVEERTKGVPSSYHVMLPEYYLREGDERVKERIADIDSTMERYLRENVFTEYRNSMILTERTFRSGKKLSGLVAAVDLSGYDYRKGSGSAIRATETTVLERIPPRVAIRRGAALEMPHVLILIDDPGKTVIEPLEASFAASDKPVYDFDLMEGGGHVKGFVLRNEHDYGGALSAMAALSDRAVFNEKYGVDDNTPVLLLAIGDGNHSLASAKALWEETHEPLSRFALAEIVNIHSPGIEFEPIHRVLMNVDAASVTAAAVKYFGDDVVFSDKEAVSGFHKIRFIAPGTETFWHISESRHLLGVGALQDFIDSYISSEEGRTGPAPEVDYIHGSDETEALGKKPGNCAFLLEAMPKSDLFKTVIKYGALPRKTFSMGHAEEKRYYLECRRIR